MNTIHKISKYRKIYPGIKALQISQDRFLEKSFIENLGIKVAEYKKVNSLDDISKTLKQKFKKGIIKTRRLGYDGKGQTIIDLKNVENIKQKIKPNVYILEKLISFKKEISVIAIRNKKGEIKT